MDTRGDHRQSLCRARRAPFACSCFFVAMRVANGSMHTWRIGEELQARAKTGTGYVIIAQAVPKELFSLG